MGRTRRGRGRLRASSRTARLRLAYVRVGTLVVLVVVVFILVVVIAVLELVLVIWIVLELRKSAFRGESGHFFFRESVAHRRVITSVQGTFVFLVISNENMFLIALVLPACVVPNCSTNFGVSLKTTVRSYFCVPTL
jgi:hypothetical protein